MKIFVIFRVSLPIRYESSMTLMPLRPSCENSLPAWTNMCLDLLCQGGFYCRRHLRKRCSDKVRWVRQSKFV